MNKLKLIAAGLVLLAVGCARKQQDAEYVVTTNVKAIQEKLAAGAPKEEGPAVAAANPTGWFTLKGTFTMNGAPARAPLNVNKEQHICAPGGKQVLSDRLIVDDATKGVRDVLVFLNNKTPSGDPAWEHESYTAKAGQPVEFDQKNCMFLNHTFAFWTSQKCKVLNSDPTGHNTNINSNEMASFNQTLAPNSSLDYDPKKQANEPAAVSCSIHPWMSANMIARDNPYFAVTKADGTFEIANLPAGVPLTFKVWHESLGTVKNATGVKFNGKKLVELVGEPDKTVEWTIELPAPK